MQLVKLWQLRFAVLPIPSTAPSKATILNYVHVTLPEKSDEIKSLTRPQKVRLKDILLLEQFFKFVENLNRCRRSFHRQSSNKVSLGDNNYNYYSN